MQMSSKLNRVTSMHALSIVIQFASVKKLYNIHPENDIKNKSKMLHYVIYFELFLENGSNKIFSSSNSEESF